MRETLKYITAAPEMKNFAPGISMAKPRNQVVCKDGARISVQASEYHYCTPRDNGGNYSEVECGFPSEPFPEAAEYKDDFDASDNNTVFAYVPVGIVAAWIEKHGGIDFEKTLAGK